MTDPAQVLELPISRQLLRDEPIMHLSYTGRDGGPRVIPIGYIWDGARFLMWTIPGAPKVDALQADGRVAITIDVPGPPPRVLLARGQAALETVDGVPDGYLEASRRAIPREAWEDFETQVRAMYKQMVAITITPHWARLLDFETTAPVAVEKLMREQTPRG
jgi:Pyridoxamine 5'-phosphate oxidase